MRRIALLLAIFLAGFTSEAKYPKTQIWQYISGFKGPVSVFGSGPSYGFCKSDGSIKACLEESVCEREFGIPGPPCSSPGTVCCDVKKSCRSESWSHAVKFQNPSFPKADTRAAVCTLDLHIGDGICALRLENEVFELANFTKDYCPTDTFTILGSKNVTTTVCGNMTGFATSFEVNPSSTVSMAMSVQGDPPYTFSISLFMMPCKDVVTFRSAPNAGMINVHGEEYVPSNRKTPPAKVAVKEDSTTTEEPSTTTTTTTKKTPVKTEAPEKANVTQASGPTPLPTGEISVKKTEDFVIAKSAFEDEDIDLASEFFDVTPNSVFKKVFNAKIRDSCRSYGDPAEAAEYEYPPSAHPNILLRKALLRKSLLRSDWEKCWYYDDASNSYKVNERCASDGDEAEADGAQGAFRVIGGKFTKINEFPWQVALIYKRKFFCGGALIDRKHVITASHCLFGSFKTGIHDLKLSLGDHDLKTKNETENVLLGVKRVIWNVHFHPDTTINDIGIIELEKPVEFSERILPINLPTDLDFLYVGQNVTVSGWGRNSLRSKTTSSVLKKFTAPVEDIKNCVKKWKKFPLISAVEGMHMCMNITYGTPCHGDSGGPLLACNKQRCTQVGLVSFGFPLCRNVGLPAVFTRITTYKRWIDINTTPTQYEDLDAKKK